MGQGGNLEDGHEPPFSVATPSVAGPGKPALGTMRRIGAGSVAVLTVVVLAVALYWATSADPGVNDLDRRSERSAIGAMPDTDSLREQYGDLSGLQVGEFTGESSASLNDRIDYPGFSVSDRVTIQGPVIDFDRFANQPVIAEEPTSERSWLLVALLTTVVIVAGLVGLVRRFWSPS